jgi:hypothetical protein
MYGNIADSLSRKREVFGMGGYTNRMGVVTKGNRKLNLIEDDPAVGFIGDEVEGSPKLLTFLF